MAGKTEKARMNLEVVLKDKVSAKFREMARIVAEEMRSIERAMRDSPTWKEHLSGVTGGAASEHLPVAEDIAGANDPFVALRETAYKTRTQLKEDFKLIRAEYKDLFPVEAEQLSTTQLARIVADVRNQRIQVVKELEQERIQVEEETRKIRSGFDFMMLQQSGLSLAYGGQRLLGFLSQSVTQAVGFNQAITNTAASLNSNLPKGIHLSTQAMDALEQKALKLGSSGYFSANQVADAMNTLARQGITTTQILNGGIKTVHDVAAANQEDINTTANVISDIVHEMGGELRAEFGPQMTHQMRGIGDAITSAMHHGRLSMQDFLNSMKYFGPQASNMGLGVKDLATGIALFAEHGIKGYQAGTAFRRMLVNLTPHTAKATAMMQSLGMVTRDGANIFFTAQGKMKPMVEIQQLLYEHMKNLSSEQRQFAINTIFGTYALSGMQAFINTAPQSFDRLHASMGKVGVTQDILAQKSQGLGMKVQAMKAHWATLQKEIGLQLIPQLLSLITAVQGLMTWFEKLPQPMQDLIVKGTLLAGVVFLVGGKIMSLIGNIGMGVQALRDFHAMMQEAKPISNMISLVGKLGGAVLQGVGLMGRLTSALHLAKLGEIAYNAVTKIATALQVAFDAVAAVNPFVWIIAGAAALVAGLIVLITHWKQVKAWLVGFFNWLDTTVRQVLNSVENVLLSFGRMVLTFFANLFGLPKKDVTVALNAIKGIFNAYTDYILGTLKVFGDLLTGRWGTAWNDVRATFKAVWNDIKGFILPVIQAIEAPIQGLMNMVTSAINAVSHLPVISGLFGGGSTPAAASSRVTSTHSVTIHVHGAPSPKETANHVAQILRTNTHVVSAH